MAKKSIFIVVAAALLSTVCVAGAFAQDDSKAGASAQSKPKAVTIGAGFAMSSRPQIEVNGSPQTDSGGGAGINVFGDYRLPIGVPLSLGLESGFSSSDVTPGDGSLTVIPILFRVGYHFNPGTKLDFYLVGKIGYAMGKIDVGGQIDESMSGLAFGFDVGVAYYFIPSVGAFLEVGVTRYGLETDIEEQGQSATIEAPFNHFLTLGIAFRF